jgi:hypothetical protein
MKIAIALLLLSLTCCSLAEAKSAAAPAPRQEAAPAAPVVPLEAPWVDSLLIGVAVLFVAALLIGPLYRLNLPQELPPPTHSHDEPPGASHRHGVSGTIDYSAPERR